MALLLTVISSPKEPISATLRDDSGYLPSSHVIFYRIRKHYYSPDFRIVRHKGSTGIIHHGNWSAYDKRQRFGAFFRCGMKDMLCIRSADSHRVSGWLTPPVRYLQPESIKHQDGDIE